MEKMKRNAGFEVLVEMTLCSVNGQENGMRHPTLKQPLAYQGCDGRGRQDGR